jgi:HTH-type transcriptional regulator / antitoxin HigA
MRKTNEYRPQSVMHPGLELKEKLEELRMPPFEFAVRCNKPVPTISKVLNTKSAITPEMAVQFEKVLRIPAKYWLRRQFSYDEAVARQKQSEVGEAAKHWARQFPYAEMAKRGWVVKTKQIDAKVEALLAFFGISSYEAWERVYLYSELKASFRVSLAHTKTPHALSAWLRRGDTLARELDAPVYSAKKLKKALPKLKSIMAAQADDFFDQIQATCLTAGVKVVHTPCLPKAPINGVARWIEDNKTPLIQLSDRHKRNDVFWFSFFHELGHILLHGKKDVFLENVDYEGKNQEKEAEADAFAVKWTFSEKQEAEVVQAEHLDGEKVLAFAERFNTHPAIIIGRMQKKGIIPYSQGQEFIVRIDLSEFE